MEWLAVKNKKDSYLFTQSRIERERSLTMIINYGMNVNTVVIRSFENQEKAVAYCDKINSVSKLLKNTFVGEL